LIYRTNRAFKTHKQQFWSISQSDGNYLKMAQWPLTASTCFSPPELGTEIIRNLKKIGIF